MTKQEYNGWTNYETWNVALWIGNDEGSARYWDEQADVALKAAGVKSKDDCKDDALSELADQLSTEIRGGAPDLGASTYADLLGAALSEVNWYEIANGLIDAAIERLPEPEIA